MKNKKTIPPPPPPIELTHIEINEEVIAESTVKTMPSKQESTPPEVICGPSKVLLAFEKSVRDVFRSEVRKSRRAKPSEVWQKEQRMQREIREMYILSFLMISMHV